MSFTQGYARKLGVLEYRGAWNAETNTPVLVGGSGQTNGYYIVSVAGATSLDGQTSWQVGDWAIFNGTKWEQIDNQNPTSISFVDGGGASEDAFDSNVIIDGGSST
jgi:hypothetical protein